MSPSGGEIELSEVLAATGGAVTSRQADGFSGVTIDGRTARPGQLYFAIRGERFDGHEFCEQATTSGASGLVVGRGQSARLSHLGRTIIEVDDTRLALGALAGAYRRRQPAQIVGVTGSAGKTTTKELCAALLAGIVGKDAVLATQGSLNNETGVPLTLFELRPHHQFAVVEMGMRALGEIEYLARLAKPDVGVVVNAGIAHVGVVGSVDAICQGKSEIWRHLGPGGKAVLPHGDPRLGRYVAALDRGHRITFGSQPGATVRVVEVTPRGIEGSDVIFEIQGKALGCRVPLVGRHNAENAACALAVARALDLDLQQGAKGLSTARPAKHRSEVCEMGGRHVLLDCYNANPASMRAAIETLGELASAAGAARAVCILGDMLELGEAEAEEHAKIGFLLQSCQVERLIAMGESARHYARGAAQAGLRFIEKTSDPELAARLVLSWTDPGDFILIKASRGMRLERVAQALAEVCG